MSTTEETTDETTRNPFTRWWFVLAALFLGLVVVAGIVLAFLTRPDAMDTQGAGPACERPASTDTGFSGALPVERWSLHGAARLPGTPFGPSHPGEPATCFEHSPGGAAVAAIHIVTLGSNGETAAALEDLAIASPAADAALSETPDPEPVPSTPVVADGFRIADYTGDTATVIVVMDTEGGYRAVTVDLLWEDGDWKWDVPTESLDVTAVYSLTGYNNLSDPQEQAHG